MQQLHLVFVRSGSDGWWATLAQAHVAICVSERWIGSRLMMAVAVYAVMPMVPAGMLVY
jgi:hypothetical protein